MSTSNRPTIGVLAGWQLYDGTTAHRFLHDVVHGVWAAARAAEVRLLLACGVGAPVRPFVHVPAWPIATPHSHFVPVGPWNCDGLIVIPPLTADARADYIQYLRRTGYPIVFAGSGEPGPLVEIDNAGGVQLAIEHLIAHGHRQIAYVAGYRPGGDDSSARFAGYQAALRLNGLTFDPELVAYGAHTFEGGREAMTEILQRGRPFTAVLASNDESAFGALAALQTAGLRVPQDIALIGFDDIIDARVQVPPLTTVHHAPFDIGYRSLQALVEYLSGTWDGLTPIQLPARLVVRHSCGCDLGQVLPINLAAERHPSTRSRECIIQTMADAGMVEAQRIQLEALRPLCARLVDALRFSLQEQSTAPWLDTLADVLQQTEALGEDVYIWQGAISTLRSSRTLHLEELGQEAAVPFDDLIDQARLVIGERARRQATQLLLHHRDEADRVGFMTAQLLATFDEPHIAATLAEHLARVGVRRLLVVRCLPDEDDPVAWSEIVLQCGFLSNSSPQRFRSRQFPPSSLHQNDEPWQFALLPFVVDNQVVGYAAFDTDNLEPCAAILHNIAAALRTSRFYREASEGRRLAEEANRLKSRFLSIVSHELRTPLNLIAGLSDIVLRDRQAATLPSQLRQDVERISDSAQHLGRLIGDVLDLASSEAGHIRLMSESLDLSETLAMVATTGERLAREKGLSWQVELPRPGPRVLGDRTRLRQVMLNLVSNAVKFTQAGGVILRVRIDEADQTPRAFIEVSDTGIGIPPEEQAEIFGEFHRSERSVTLGFRGLGLGLTICKHLIELHGGSIRVRSSGVVGEGTTFEIMLPQLAAQSGEPHLLGWNEGDRVAVVLAGDTHRAAVVKTYLARHGMSVQEVPADTTIADIIALLACQPRAVIVDRDIAVQRGWELAAALRRHPVTAQLPLLVFALDPAAERGALLELHHQLKPLDRESIAQLLVQHGLQNDRLNAPAKTVLVVDDDRATRELHARLIEASGTYRVLLVEDGDAALEVMRSHHPDLVLLDLLMPRLDGFGLLEAMQGIPELRDIPVVVLTAQVLTEDDLMRLNHGVSAILAKGLFSVDEMLAHVQAAIGRHRKLSSTTQRLIHKALIYIHTHYGEPITREQIAGYVGVNENYLTDCFHREMGITPVTYLTRYRVHQACSLLQSTDCTITEVASTVGFGDSAYFSRVFLRTTGISPSAYRRHLRSC